MLFKPMAIYSCTYSNMHQDPTPLAFILYSDSDKTHALNIHYLSPTQRFNFFNMIRKLAGVGKDTGAVFHYNGEMLYNILKRYYPQFANVSYRTYFSRYLIGTLVNDALNAASPLMTLYLKTQNLVNKSSSNYMSMKAKLDPGVIEVNKQLMDTRVDQMNNYEDMQFTLTKYPGPASKPPDTVTPEEVTPQQLRDAEQKRQQQGGWTAGQKQPPKRPGT